MVDRNPEDGCTMKAFKQRAWLYVVVGVLLVWFLIIVPQYRDAPSQNPVEDQAGQVTDADDEALKMCEVCGAETAVVVQDEDGGSHALCEQHREAPRAEKGKRGS